MKGTESIQAASGYFNLANTIDGKQVKNSLYLKGKTPPCGNGHFKTNMLPPIFSTWMLARNCKQQWIGNYYSSRNIWISKNTSRFSKGKNHIYFQFKDRLLWMKTVFFRYNNLFICLNNSIFSKYRHSVQKNRMTICYV